MKKQKPKSKKVILDKEKLMRFVDSRKIIHEWPIPEKWGEMFGSEKESHLKIRGASLNDHLTCQKLATQPGILFAYIEKCSEEGRKVDFKDIENLLTDERLGENTIFELSIFKKNVIKPRFNEKEVLAISEKCPELINEAVKVSLGLTAMG